MTFQKLGVKLLANKMLHDLRKLYTKDVELEHYAEQWLNSLLDADREYKDLVFSKFLGLLKNV